MEEKNKNIISFLLRIAISGGLLLFIFSKIDIPETIKVVKSADLLFLFYALIIFLVTQFLLLYRWIIFIHALRIISTLMNITRHFFIGMVGNLVLPTAIGGDVVKTVGLCKAHSQKPRVVASVLLDRLSGFAGIALLAISAYILGYKMIDDKVLIIPVALMGVGSATIIILLFNKTVYTFACYFLKKFPKLENGLMTMHEDIQLLKERKIEGFKAIGVSFLGQIIYAASLYFIAKSLHQDISLVYFLIFSPIICVVSMVPSIGGLGVREVGAVYLFGKIGVESGVAASITLMIFLFMIIIGVIGGVFYVFTVSD